MAIKGWPTVRSAVMLGFACVIPAIALAPTTYAQSSGVIDGSKNPAAIPDTVAYEHFFGVLETKAGIPAAQNDIRRMSYLGAFFRLGCGSQNDDRTLPAEQKAKLVGVAENLAASLRSIQQSASALGAVPQNNPQLLALQLERDQAIQAAIDSIPTAVD